MDTRPTSARLRLLASVGAVAVVVAGCGSLGGLPGRVEAPQLVTAAQIQHYPQDSPARTVLQWWRALQFGSPEVGARYYASRLHMTPRRLQERLAIGADLLSLKAGLQIVDVVKHGDRATVFALRNQVLLYPNRRKDEIRSPQAFNLVRDHGTWRLADNRYIDHVWANVKSFVKQGSARKKDAGAP
jgi:hypothetical protein